MNRSLCLTATTLLVAGGNAWGATPGAKHAVGGTINGLAGKGLVLRLDSPSAGTVDVSPPPGAVRFAFPAGLASGSAYAVTVQSQPTGPNQLCAVTRSQAGRIGTSDVSDAVVDCASAATAHRPGLQFQEGRAWDIYADAFDVKVDIDNISFNDGGSCSMSGGTVNAAFRLSPGVRGMPVGRIQWDAGRTQSLAIEFHVDSDAMVGPQVGQSSGVPKTCEASKEHFKDNTYRMVGDLKPEASQVTMTSPMPEDGDTTGNHGCPGGAESGNMCYVQYWFDNSPGTARTTLDLDGLLSTGSVVVPVHGTAINVAGYRETRSGNYTWSGTVSLRAVPVWP